MVAQGGIIESQRGPRRAAFTENGTEMRKSAMVAALWLAPTKTAPNERYTTYSTLGNWVIAPRLNALRR
jgi:hypothetical protein